MSGESHIRSAEVVRPINTQAQSAIKIEDIRRLPRLYYEIGEAVYGLNY